VLAFDLPGHGKSEGPRGHIESYDLVYECIDLLLQESRQRYPQVPLFLYGHSLGGNIVLNYALQRKPQLAGVISTSPGLGLESEPRLKLLIGKVLYTVAPKFSMPNGLDRSGLSRDPSVEQRYSADPLVHSLISARLGMDLISKGKWARENAANFPIPLLLMQGSADRLVAPAATREFAARAPADLITYKEWEGGYHELHNDIIKEEVLNFMLGWIATRMQ